MIRFVHVKPLTKLPVHYLERCWGKISTKSIEMSVFEVDSHIKLSRTYSMRPGDITKNNVHLLQASTFTVPDTLTELLNDYGKVKWSETLTQIHETYSPDEYDRNPPSPAEKFMMHCRNQCDIEMGYAVSAILSQANVKYQVKCIAQNARRRYLYYLQICSSKRRRRR